MNLETCSCCLFSHALSFLYFSSSRDQSASLVDFLKIKHLVPDCYRMKSKKVIENLSSTAFKRPSCTGGDKANIVYELIKMPINVTFENFPQLVYHVLLQCLLSGPFADWYIPYKLKH